MTQRGCASIGYFDRLLRAWRELLLSKSSRRAIVAQTAMNLVNVE